MSKKRYNAAMKVTTHKTKAIVSGDDLFAILDTSLPRIDENSIVVVTSKIVSICEGTLVKMDEHTTKETLVEQEADLFVPIEKSNWGYQITTKESIMAGSAGIDESNGNGYFILWPRDPQKSAERIWRHIKNKFSLKNLGIVIVDSRLTPLRWGTVGVALSHCGFKALNDYRGSADIFGRELKVTQSSIRDGLAAAAVLLMGEGAEQTPLATITDVPFVQFQQNPPTPEELANLQIELSADVFGPVFASPLWKKGKGGR